MGYLTLSIALGVILLFGLWSRNRRLKAEKKRQKLTIPNVYPLKRSKSQTKLRRIK